MDISILIMLFFVNNICQIQPSQENPEVSEDNPEASSHACPNCGSDHTVKNGSTHHGKPKRLCRNCGRQFVNSPTQKIVSQSERQLIDRLLLENISLRGIAR